MWYCVLHTGSSLSNLKPPKNKQKRPFVVSQFGIYEFIRSELMNRKVGEHKPRKWIPPAVRRRFGIGGDIGVQQPEYVKDFLKNVYLLEEELV